MLSLEIEVPGVVLGFGIGAATFLLHGLLVASQRGAAAKPEVQAQEPAPAQGRRRLPLWAALLCAGLAALLLAAPLAWPAGPTSDPAPDPTAALLPEAPPGDAAPSLAPEEPLPPVVAADMAPAMETTDTERPSEAETAPATTSATQGTEEADDGLMTLTLTRQQLSVQQEEGIYYKTAYWGTVTAGEPAMPFNVVFDTGSGHLILPSTYCHSETCRAHKRFRRASSATAKDIDYDGVLVEAGELRDHITVSFGTGEVTGVFIEDVVCLGADDEEGMVIFNESENAIISRDGAIAAQRRGLLPEGCLGLRMIAATEMSEDPFKDFQFDGVLGLGLSGLSQSPGFNLMHVLSTTALEAKGKNPNIFAVFLAESDREQSEITFGGFAQKRLESELAWHPVYEPSLGQWMVQVKSIRVDDGEPIEYCRDGDCRAIVDTGTSLIAVPTPVFPELFELMLHPADIVEECKGPGPRLHIELESITVTLEPRDYALLERATRSRVRALITQDEEDAEDDMCKAMLMAMDLPAPLGPKLFILGEPVLRRYYTVYDSSSSPRVGFARARHANGELVE